MKPRHLLLIASIAAFALSALSAGGAFANDRYAIPPPVTVSPDVSAPWVTQLQPVQPASQYRSSSPSPAYSPKAQPRLPQKATTQKPAKKTTSAARKATTPQQAPVIRASVAAPANPKRAAGGLNPVYLPQDVDYNKDHKPGTIVIDTKNKFLYLVGQNGKARRYGVGVGKQGFSWKGTQTISRKAEWPTWTPPAAMIARERKKGRILPAQMKGGINNPLGARALYLGNTLYRIHGTNAPSTIGKAVSSGCIRMRNQDVEDLYNRVTVGTKVIVM
ncbi:L,D-transpeptidase [Pseudochrobactrum sp. HB0163]|uniref:L,D-transpeptidase n=1 Tax=Pseudochrobactrum sp. HB0163 TaxID=3450708 RepID=UPI003F6DBEE4